jgi:hypothetical protein
MNKVALFAGSLVLFAVQAEVASAQSVSSGMMSRPSYHKKLRVTEGIRVTPPRRARLVASPSNSVDPIATGSISKRPN